MTYTVCMDLDGAYVPIERQGATLAEARYIAREVYEYEAALGNIRTFDYVVIDTNDTVVYRAPSN